jgi:hypothetical protein
MCQMCGSGYRFPGRQAILQAGVAELADGPDRAQDTTRRASSRDLMTRTGVRSEAANCANAREEGSGGRHHACSGDLGAHARGRYLIRAAGLGSLVEHALM